MIDVHCCAATCVHELVCGDGRHLADHPAELPQELPQVGTRRTTTKTILNQYNKNNTLVDHDRQRSHRNIEKEPEDPDATWSFGTSEFAYLRYFQYNKTKDAESTAGLFAMRNRIIMTEQTYYRYTRSPTINFVTEYHCGQNDYSYSPFVFELICSRNDCNFPRRRHF